LKITMKRFLLGLGVALLIPASWALADWTARDSSGATVTFNALTTSGGKILPKHVVTDVTGAFPVSVSSGGALKVDPSGTTMAATQSGTWSVGMSGSLPAGTNVIGGVTQSGGPWATNLAQLNGVAVSSSNPVPTTCVSGCTSADPTLATYSVGTSFIVGGSPTDLALIQGSATKVIKIRRIWINFSISAGANAEVILMRRSTGNSSGVPVTLIPGRHDTTDPPATATVTTYGGTATTGTLVSTLFYTVLAASTTNTLAPPTEIRYGVPNGDKPIVLRGTSDYLAIGTSSGANSTNARLTIEWTEE
jgi:hypothetical protein